MLWCHSPGFLVVPQITFGYIELLVLCSKASSINSICLLGDCNKVLGVAGVALSWGASAQKGALRIHDGLRCAQDIELSFLLTISCILLRRCSSIGKLCILPVETPFLRRRCLLLRL